MKKILNVGVIVLLLAFALPVSNFFIGAPSGTALTEGAKGNPEFEGVAAILERSCLNCHSTDTVMPFYAKLPVAKGLVARDMSEGLSYLDMAAEFMPPGGGPATEVSIAKTEYEVARGTMPPHRYTALHWDAMLSANKKKAILEWIESVRVKHYATPGLPPEVQKQVIRPLPQKVDEDPRKVALGKALYNDVRLSGDDTISCASCHDLAKGGTDQRKVSEGVRGQLGGINAPTTFNSGFQFKHFWDGRAATLEAQADGPPNNPIEMDSNWGQIVGKLEADEAFTQAFNETYPDGYSKEHLTGAIAIFERTLVTPNSRFDQFLMGKVDALTDDEKQGYDIFIEQGCATCHVGNILGGQSFEKMGRKGDYFAQRGNVQEADYGRMNATGKEADRYHFKVPTLRNITLTHPYLHDGTTSDLAEVVQVMARYQSGEKLSGTEARLVAKFLETLTGEYEGKPL